MDKDGKTPAGVEPAKKTPGAKAAPKATPKASAKGAAKAESAERLKRRRRS